jgi:hypothetical protein
MSYTMSNLIMDVLPRIGRQEKPSGITVYQAANSILSLIFKRLLERRSELIASGALSISIPALGYYGSLPSDFWSMSAKPQAVEVLTNWMAGTVTSYNTLTGALVVNSLTSSGTDTLTAWSIALGALPGSPASTIGTSVTSLTVGTGAKSLTTQLGLSLTAGQYIIISSATLPSDWENRYHTLEPKYMAEDNDHDELSWWEWYGVYGESWEPPVIRPRNYKIIGTTMYVRPKVTQNVIITGTYSVKPTAMSAEASVIPWNSMFDEIFREGVVMIVMRGIAIPTDELKVYVNGAVDAVVDSRIVLVRNTRRIKKGNWL